MSKYFNLFPKTVYTNSNTSTSLDTVTNIIARFGFEASLKQNATAFYKYQIQEGDTPEIIAYKYYDHPERHWIVLMFNDIVDPQFDWPMPYNTFINYVDKKYTANGAANTTSQTGLAWAMSNNNVKAYYKIVTRVTRDNTRDGTTIEEKFEVDANTYATIASTTTTYSLADGTTTTETISKEKKTYYQYEQDLNEEKREINLLKKEFVAAVEKEFKKVIKS